MNENGMTDKTVLEVRGLRKEYGDLVAVNGVDLAVRRGEIFGLLGHNGAGKTTTIECIVGTKARNAGTVALLGKDPARDRKEVFSRVGVQFQNTRFQDKLRVSEACESWAALYETTARKTGKKLQDWRELLARFHLDDKKKTFTNDLSGGERQKLAVVLALLHSPEVLFLDELTTGLDPQARRGVWNYLKELKAGGVTIVLTSHYMDEVEYLCDRIAILKHGTITAEMTPAELVARHGTKNLEDAYLREEEMEAVQ
jgi:ABC-2 type transport system ATP-binding protein